MLPRRWLLHEGCLDQCAKLAALLLRTSIATFHRDPHGDYQNPTQFLIGMMHNLVMRFPEEGRKLLEAHPALLSAVLQVHQPDGYDADK